MFPHRSPAQAKQPVFSTLRFSIAHYVPRERRFEYRFLRRHGVYSSVLCRGALLLILAVSGLCGNIFAQSEVLPAPWHSQPLHIDPAARDRSLPQISNGYIWSFRYYVNAPDNDALVLESAANGKQSRVPFWISGAAEVWLEDVTVVSNGSILVAGSFTRPGDPAQQNYIARLDASGKLLRRIDLGEYEPERICATGESIWTLGQIWGAELQDDSYRLLRKYSSTGRLLAAYAERRDLPVHELNLSVRLHNVGGAHDRVFLRCSSQTIGAYIGPGKTWLEVEVPTGQVTNWKVNIPSHWSRITGLVFLGSQNVYASFVTPSEPGVAPSRGIFRLQFTSQLSASWKSVELKTSTNSGQITPTRLIGEDQSNIVSVGYDAADGVGTLFWSRPHAPSSGATR